MPEKKKVALNVVKNEIKNEVKPEPKIGKPKLKKPIVTPLVVTPEDRKALQKAGAQTKFGQIPKKRGPKNRF